MKAIVSEDGQHLVAIVQDGIPTRADVTREFVDETKEPPAYDPKTHRLAVRFKFSPTTVTKSLEAVPLSVEELDAIASAAETERIRTIMENLRSGQGTAAERLARLERVVGHICKLTLQA